MPTVPTRVLVELNQAVGIALDVLSYIEDEPDSSEHLIHIPQIVLGWVKHSLETHLPEAK